MLVGVIFLLTLIKSMLTILEITFLTNVHYCFLLILIKKYLHY